MTRFVPEHFRPDGRPKRRWPTETAARRAAGAYDKDYYRCGFCGQFHIGTPSPR